MPTPSRPTGRDTLLSLQGISYAYPSAPTPVFENLSADLPAGVGLVCGDEGSGKSTLLHLLAGQLKPLSGLMLMDGAPMQDGQVARMDPLDAEHDHVVAQDVLNERVPSEWQHHLRDLLPGLDLLAHLPKPLYQLSTGSRRKVFLAATLARQARLTLLDQPFIALDRPSVDFLQMCFKAWAGADDRLLLIADYLPPEDVPLSFTLNLDGVARKTQGAGG